MRGALPCFVAGKVQCSPSKQGGGNLNPDASGNGPAPAFFRIRDVLRITALSRPTLYRRIAAQRFPAPVHLGGRACGWPSAALQAWIKDPEGYCAPQASEAMTLRKPGRPRKYPA